MAISRVVPRRVLPSSPERSRYQLVQPPAPADPMQSLSGLLETARGLSALEDAAKHREAQRHFDTLVDQAQGDSETALQQLEAEGKFGEARTRRDDAQVKRNATLAAIDKRLAAQTTPSGKGAQLLHELTQAPSLYNQLRPSVIDLVARVDPRMRNEVPEFDSPEQVRGLVQFAMDSFDRADQRRRADLATLEQMRRSGSLSDDDYTRGKLRIENAYRSQVGEPALADLSSGVR